MKPITFLCTVVISILLLQSSRADTPMPPSSPFVIVSQDGQCFFKMIPGKGKWQENKYVVTRMSFGVAYSIDENGNFKELWKTSGWYSSQVFLSDDGQYLVRMGPWNSGNEPKKGDLAVAFYKNGNLLKEYFTTDLVKDKSKVKATASHYFWLATDPKLDGDNVLQLKTMDGIMYQFDATTGEIKKTEKP
jgi:hypothetical protein